MGANKRQKVDFKDALAGMDSVEFQDAAGAKKTILRGDMSDSAWDGVKKRAAAMASEKPAEATADTSADKPAKYEVGKGKLTMRDAPAPQPVGKGTLETHDQTPSEALGITDGSPVPDAADWRAPAAPAGLPALLDATQPPAPLPINAPPVHGLPISQQAQAKLAEPVPGGNPIQKAFAPISMEGFVPPSGATPAPEAGASGGGATERPGVQIDPNALPEKGSGSASAGSSRTTPGTADALPQVSPHFRDELATQAEKHALALEAAGEITSKKEKARAQTMRDAMAEQAKLDADAKSVEQARQDTYNRMNDAHQQTINQLGELMKKEVDPNRYWASKTGGQKALAVIAGGLFGFSGQGMQWLNRLDNLINADIQQQNADLSRQRGLLGDVAGEQKNAMAMARQNGLDSAAAVQSARVAMKNHYADVIEEQGAESNSQMAMQNAAMAAAQLRTSAARDAADFDFKAQHAAAQAMSAQADMIRARASASADYARASATRAAANAPKGPTDQKTPPGIRVEESKIEAGLKAIKEARAAVKSDTNTLADQWALTQGDSLRKMGFGDLANLMFPDTSGRTAVAESAQENVLKAVKGENLLEADLARALPRMARPGFSKGNTKWLDAMEEILLARKNKLATTRTESGVTTEQAQPDFTPAEE